MPYATGLNPQMFNVENDPLVRQGKLGVSDEVKVLVE
jgi:hypothetical protein